MSAINTTMLSYVNTIAKDNSAVKKNRNLILYFCQIKVFVPVLLLLILFLLLLNSVPQEICWDIAARSRIVV